MGINSIGYSGSLFGQAVLNLNNQLTNLSTELATGEKSTTYAGMGINEGFAVAARSQLSNISAFGDTITNVNTIIGAANTALQSLTSIATTVQSDASTTSQDINSTGQTIGQANAQSQFISMVGILNTQVGDRYIFSGSAINTPSVAPADQILNGNGTQAGLKQVIAERAQADGTTGLGRLVISSTTVTGTAPTSTGTFSVSEDAAGSPFGLKLSSVSSGLTGATVTGPSGSPASVSFSLPANPNPGDQVTLNFNLPDGTTSSVTLTATTQNPPPTGSFLIATTGTGAPDPGTTAQNLNTALNTAIGKLANTTLVAASAVAAGNDFFNPSSSATGAVANDQEATPQPITGATLLSGAAGTASLSTGFQNVDAITVNGTTVTFSTSSATSLTGPTYNINPTTGTVGNLLSAIDSITGTTTPSSIDGGAVTINAPNAANFSISASSSDPNAQAALAALGFSQAAGTATTTASGTTISAIQPPLRVSGSPLSSATKLVNGSADTVAWYTGNNSPDPRASSTALIDSGISVQYGLQANEQAIRQQLEGTAVYAALTESPTGTNSAAQAAALSTRIATNLTSQRGQQQISDIQTDLANAQTTMKAASARQTQTQTQLQNMIDGTETVSTQQVASEILALQTSLSASYQTTSILSKLTLTNFLPPGG
ncbi:beta strand repeat-containing protein [Bradyrhizobium sp.]|uniref:beta strand repeat-containing protein n=1 Tax=Bradyrhizobium sp. TaxID=376 RepID=UPI003C64E41C